MKEKILKDGDVVTFVNSTKEYGRAEFSFCPVVKRGQLQEIYIYPKQQKNTEYFYKIPVRFADSWQVLSWTHKGMQPPKVWLFYWCKEHKCQGFNVYVPPEANRFSVSILSTVSINFDV